MRVCLIRSGWYEFLTLGLVVQKIINLGGCAIVSNDGESLVVHVEDEVLALDQNQ